MFLFSSIAARSGRCPSRPRVSKPRWSDRRSIHHNIIWNHNKTPTNTTAEEAVKIIKSGDRVFVQSVAAAPTELLHAMTSRSSELLGVEVCHLHIEGDAPHCAKGMEKSFYNNNLFVGANCRNAVQEGRAGYVPVFLSEVPSLFEKGILPIDVALIQVSPPDKHGFCSLGVSVDVSVTAVECAKHVIALVNPNMPRTHGDGIIHINCIDTVVQTEVPILEYKLPAPSVVEKAIGMHVAKLVEDGATLQMGIGSIPDATLASLNNHKGLGIHTEMFSDGVMNLIEKGVITNEHKKVHPNMTVAGFVMGSRKLYDFIDDNPSILMRDISEVNNPTVIAQNPKVTAINSCVEVDLSGQICADSIGGMIYSGVGGQMDFLRGAALSDGGKPILALPSTTSKGKSRIVPFLKRGAGVVTTRAHVHWVVTEYGSVNLHGLNLEQRAKALISISHPSFREKLTQAYDEKYWQHWNDAPHPQYDIF